jgi:hypothetical protein
MSVAVSRGAITRTLRSSSTLLLMSSDQGWRPTQTYEILAEVLMLPCMMIQSHFSYVAIIFPCATTLKA